MTGHLARLAGLPTPAGLRDGPIYLDYNATTPADPRVVEAMLPYLTTHFGNPSSGHHHAGQPRRAAADEIVFTGSGSEADTLAIHGTVMAHRRPAEVQVITQAHRASSGAGGLPRLAPPVWHRGDLPAGGARRAGGPARPGGGDQSADRAGVDHGR